MRRIRIRPRPVHDIAIGIIGTRGIERRVQAAICRCWNEARYGTRIGIRCRTVISRW